METLNYIKSLFVSYFQDMKSKTNIIQNGWHKHIPISIVFIILFVLKLKTLFILNEAIWFQYFVLLGIPFCLYWGFERLQGMYAKLVGKSVAVKFESDKDVVASWFISSIIGIILYTILIIK